MKSKIFLLLYFFALAAQAQLSPNYLPENDPACGGVNSLLQRKGHWQKIEDDVVFPDKSFLAQQYKQAFNRMDFIASLFKQTVSEPHGFEPRWQRSIRGDAYQSKGPVPYKFSTICYQYFCGGNPKKILLEDEAATRVDVFINKMQWFFTDVGKWVIDNNGTTKTILQLPPTEGKWNGLTVYKISKIWNFSTHCKSNAVVLGRNGKIPWHSLTQKQYLTGLKNQHESNLKTYRLGSFQDVDTKGKIEWIEKYLVNASEASLQQPAIIDPKFGIWGFKGVFGDEANGGYRLVSPAFNNKYFTDSLPAYVPQLIQFMWTYMDDSRISLSIKEQIEKAFPLKNLAAMIDNTDVPVVEEEKPYYKQYIIQFIDRTNINRIVDSLFKNYKFNFPSFTGASFPPLANKDDISWPSPNTKKNLLAARRLNTKEEVLAYIDEIEKNFAPSISNSTAYDDAATNGQAAMGNWLADKPADALALAIRAVKQSPDNNTLLDNLATTIDLCGGGYIAIPLHIVCIKKEPGNSTIANNTGQAYLGLGDVANAESYLQKAIASTPYHPNANNSLGLIYLSQGKREQAIACFQNSLRGSFTMSAYKKLLGLHKESALRLMNLIRHRYRQPDYINFNKYPVPLQCTTVEEIPLRIKEHKAYKELLNTHIKKYEQLRLAQKPLAEASLKKIFFPSANQKPTIKPFQAFAQAMIISIRYEQEERLKQLEKDLVTPTKEALALRMEYDTAMKAMAKSFESRVEKEGEGNPEPTLAEEMCAAKNSIANHYLLRMAKTNEDKFTKLIQAHKDFLNDYLYWIRLASFTPEQYQAEYYEICLQVLRLLQKVELTTVMDYCLQSKPEPKAKELQLYEPDCPLPKNFKLPFVVGKVYLNCDRWDFEVGEGVVLNIAHKFGAETTIAFGPGLLLEATPVIVTVGNSSKPLGVSLGAKGQLFVSFNGNAVLDAGFLWETKIELNAILKPIITKQNFSWAINKGFTAEGPLTTLIDKIYEIPAEKQINKNIPINKPQQ